MNRLYYAADSTDEARAAMLISPDTIAKALRGIYNGGKGKDSTYISPALFNAITDMLRKAEEEGLDSSSAPDPDDDFRQALSHADDVFAAFKVHRMQRDMGRMLTDEDGELKPFTQWMRDVLPIASHQCGAWLRTEYDTAVLRAHQAADWQQYERERDVLPNLKWMPSTSINPGTDHMPFWNTVRPIDDPFWDEHRPGDRWNCKCSLTSTDEPVTATPQAGKESDPQPHQMFVPSFSHNLQRYNIFSQIQKEGASNLTRPPFVLSVILHLFCRPASRAQTLSVADEDEKLVGVVFLELDVGGVAQPRILE